MLAIGLMSAELSSTTASAPTSTRRVALEFEHECVQLFSEFVQVLGLPRSAGQIYGLLFSSPSPLCFSDIVERLEISKGSASQGLRLLRTLGAIKLVIPAGGQTGEQNFVLGRDYYEPELGLRKLVSGVLHERIAPMAAAGEDSFVRLRRLAEADESRNFFLSERVKQLETWRKRYRTILPVLSALFGPK